MAAYATTTDLATFGLSADALAGIDTNAQTAALTAASRLADGYLRARFTLPIATPSVDLVEAVCKIAAYTLLSARGFNPEAGADQNIRDRYRDALAWLKDVAAGTATPALTDSSPAGQLGGPFVLQSQLQSDGLPLVVSGGRSTARGW